jgi:hypothetical protein
MTVTVHSLFARGLYLATLLWPYGYSPQEYDKELQECLAIAKQIIEHNTPQQTIAPTNPYADLERLGIDAKAKALCASPHSIRMSI